MEPHQFNPCIELPFDQDEFVDIVEKSKDWAIMHGAAMRPKKNFDPDSLTFAPFTLIPSSFPRREFNKAVDLQIVLNELIHNVAHSHEFLSETLKYTIEADEFTGKLYKIYETVRSEGISQLLSLGIVRSDVMLDPSVLNGSREAVCSLKQVEFNTIASGFGHLGPISTDIHRLGHKMSEAFSLGLLRGDYLIDYPNDCKIKQVEINTVATSLSGLATQFTLLHRFVLNELGRNDLLKDLPENSALSGLCGGMIRAWQQYAVPKAVILFIVEDTTYNICDQRFHEFYIRNKMPEIKILRKSLTYIGKHAILSDDKRLIVDGNEVALVYYRSGYEPTQYHGDVEWDARLLMERSLAIKCPSIHYHLAGTKKVQQALALPGTVEKFLKDQSKVKAVRDIFTGIFSLDRDPTGDAVVAMALKDPHRYVLKPQREGGGNNVYGAQVKTKLEEIQNSDERNGWILMERINPPVQKTYILRPGLKEHPDNSQVIVSELGIFGVIMGDAKCILINQQCGHMLRTKLSSADEGGVAAGAGCLDSPYLID